jgi:hypothetical protein
MYRIPRPDHQSNIHNSFSIRYTVTPRGNAPVEPFVYMLETVIYIREMNLKRVQRGSKWGETFVSFKSSNDNLKGDKDQCHLQL